MAVESSNSSARKRVKYLEDPLQKLQLTEAERRGVVLAKADGEDLPRIKWMAAAKLLTIRAGSVEECRESQ